MHWQQHGFARDGLARAVEVLNDDVGWPGHAGRCEAGSNRAVRVRGILAYEHTRGRLRADADLHGLRQTTLCRPPGRRLRRKSHARARDGDERLPARWAPHWLNGRDGRDGHTSCTSRGTGEQAHHALHDPLGRAL